MIGYQRPNIETGLSVYWRPCWCQTRQGQIIRCNGLDRGSITNGYGTAKQLGMDAPAAGPTVVRDPAAGAALSATYYCGFRYVDDSGEITAYSDLSPLTTVAAQTNDGFDWTVPYSPQARCTKIQLFRSTGDQAKVLYLVATVANPGSGNATYDSDNSSDATLRTTCEALPILSQNLLYARRFGMPPDYKRVAVQFQDRTWYLVDAVYDEGTVAVTNGSPTVTGTGTHFTSVMAGRYFYLRGGDKHYLIDSVNVEAQTLTLSANYGGVTASGKAYMVHPGLDQNNRAYFSEPDEPESVPTSQNTLTIQENLKDDHDFLTGAIPGGSVLWALKDRHVYKITYVSQPQIDAVPRLRFYRGCLSQACHTSLHGTHYLLDAKGPWRITPDEQSDDGFALPTLDFFRDSRVDWGKARWWHVDADATRGIVRFWVTLAGQGGTRPKTALCFHQGSGKWWTVTYPEAFGQCCPATLLGQTRAFAAGQYDRILLLDEGHSDGVSYQGAVTAATSTTLSDTTAGFSLDMIGGTVTIVDGTGAGQTSTVTSRPSATQLGVAAWDVTPDTTSRYAVQYHIRGTATGGSVSSLVDTTRTFEAELSGAPVAILEGTGAGQVRVVKTATGNTLTPAMNFTTAPDATSVYQVGDIAWSYRTGKRPATAAGPRNLGVSFLPTANEAKLRASVTFDHDALAALLATHATPYTGLSVGDDKRHVLLDIKKARSTLGDEPGRRVIHFGIAGRVVADRGMAQRQLAAYKFWGHQASEQLTLYALEP